MLADTYWEYKLDPDFPFQAFEYVTIGNADKLHWHDYLQIGLCLDGKGKFIFSNKEFEVTQGDIFIVSNFENHVAISEPDQITKYLFIIFLPELIAPPGSRVFDFEYLSPFWYNMDTFSNKIEKLNNSYEIISQSLVEIKMIWDKQDMGYKHLVEANLRKVLAEFITYCHKKDPGYTSINVDKRIKLQPALYFINQHFRETISLEAASAILHMSESRFRHFFKEVTNFNFREYISYLRINEAKKLLISTDMKIADMIDFVGYSNTYQFYKLFAKYVSMTPAEYRQYYQQW